MHFITLQLVSYSFEGHDLWLGEVKALSRLLLQSKGSPGQERVKNAVCPAAGKGRSPPGAGAEGA